MSRWVRVDRRYNQPYRFTGYAYRAIFKWTGLLFLWIVVNGILSAAHLGLSRPWLRRQDWSGMRSIAHAVAASYSSPRARSRPSSRSRGQRTGGSTRRRTGRCPRSAGGRLLAGSLTRHGRRHHLAGSSGCLTRSPRSGSATHVSSRKMSRSRWLPGMAAGAASAAPPKELHLDHVVPWSKGGANTVANIQLLCGPCNRRKGAVEDLSSSTSCSPARKPLGLMGKRAGSAGAKPSEGVCCVACRARGPC